VQLDMNTALAAAYRSRSQIARVVTEDWVARSLYCPGCNAASIIRSIANTRAIDFNCSGCSAAYQLKSGSRWNENRIPDAGYEAMIAAIRSDNVPNLLLMQYSVDWKVINLTFIPSFFFTEASIEKRLPLSPTARRAGWIGCNILLSAIAPEGKIPIVSNGLALDTQVVRNQYQRIKPLAGLDVSFRGWTVNVLRFVHRLRKSTFSLRDVYAFEGELGKLYPRNRNVRPKIRQQLQVLRDLGLVVFLGSGQYALRQ
jgi:type II restriction enzyme